MSGSKLGSSLWDPPGKNTGVGCHFLLQCMKVKRESEVVSNPLRPHRLQPPSMAPPSMGFSRQEYWSGLPLHMLRDHLRREFGNLGKHIAIR